jgi:soluble lytic murein transglycosylase-like protein
MAVALLSAGWPALAEPPGVAALPPRPSVDAICRMLAQAAAANDLQQEFFARLMWQESRFDRQATSSTGAQGIAQFMPATATMRGLTNEPLQALRLGELPARACVSPSAAISATAAA